jgi:glycerol-3-phosphate O-acyltransferase
MEMSTESPYTTHPSVQPPKPYEPAAPLKWLYQRFFSHIRVDDAWSGVVRAAAAQGVVVYVMRSLSFLDFLCLDFLVKRFGLPFVQFVNDLGLWILEPFGRGGRRLRLRRQIPEDAALVRTLEERASALLFLRNPPRFGSFARHGKPPKVDLMRTLVAFQRTSREPILLVPQTFVWTMRKASTKRSLVDWLLGPTESPGKVRVFFQFLLNYKNALLRSGEPFNLGAFVDANAELDDEALADKVRFAMTRRLERERTLVLGPSKKEPKRLREEILRSPRVRKHVVATARNSEKSEAAIIADADRELKKLCAAADPYVVGLFHRFLSRLFHRIYSGVVVDEPGIERVRQAGRHSTLIFIPSHKSHMDYLVLSEILYARALSPPVIAAGDNLNFWPAGPVLRRGGAFFIRRSFRGKKLYSVLVEAYLRKLLVEGFNMEFFIEGGRSRTGKLLQPKLGLLSMIVDAALSTRRDNLLFVPVSIGYERVIEERSYVYEIAGGDKRKEDIGGLLKAPKMLQSTYGRLYVQFGELLSLKSLIQEVQSKPASRAVATPSGASGSSGLLSPPQKRALVQRAAHQIVYEINRATIVTPASLVAMVMLAHRRRGMSQRELVETTSFLCSRLVAMGARIAPSMLDEQGALRVEAVGEAIRLFVQGRLVQVHSIKETDPTDAVYVVPEERRIALEYYKNNILHFFVPFTFIASAVRVAANGKPNRHATVRERVMELSRLFKYEFVYRSDQSFEDTFSEALATLLDAGNLISNDDELHPAGGSRGAQLGVYASMARTYFEGYLLALRGVEAFVREEPLSKKEWVRKALSLGQRMYLAGEIEERESISAPKLENALLAFRDLGLVRISGDDEIEMVQGPETQERVRSLSRSLEAYVIL